MSSNGSSNSSSHSEDHAQAVQPVVTAADTVLVVESAAVTEMAPVPAAVNENEDEDEDEDKDDGAQAAVPTAGGLYKDIFGSDGSDLSASESEDEDEEERPTATARLVRRSPSPTPSASSASSAGSRFSPSRSRPARQPPSDDDDDDERRPSAAPKKIKRARTSDVDDDQRPRDKARLKKRKKKENVPVLGQIGSDGEELPEMDEATRRKLELSARIESIGKGLKKKRKVKKATADGEEDITADAAVDQAIERTREEMERAVMQDQELRSKGQPAVLKTRLLPKVLSVMQNVTMQQAILDSSEFLESIRRWLEPLHDGSLPSLNIQRSIMGQLKKMDITKENLKESGLGKVIFFYTRSKRVQADIARLANDLYDRWSRLILNQGSAADRRAAAAHRAEAAQQEDDEDDRGGESDDARGPERSTTGRKKRDPGALLLNRKVEDRDADDLLAASSKTTRIPSQIGHAYHEAPRPIRSLHDASQQAQMESRLREHEKLNRFKRKALLARSAR